jgi:hypothetical protein
MSEAKVREIHRQHKQSFQAPTRDELLIEIDGTAPWEDQYRAFAQQLPVSP